MDTVVTRVGVPLETRGGSSGRLSWLFAVAVYAVLVFAVLAFVVTVESCRVDRRGACGATARALRGNIRDGVYSDHVDSGGM